MRLIAQFHRLAEGLPAESRLSLAQVAERLCCGERNARLLLGRMQAESWLRWAPGQGRGKPSVLYLLQQPTALRHAALQRLLAEGRLEAAFSGLPGAARERLQQALPAFLGASPGGGLRMPFYRPLHALDPIHVTRRTEAHLVAQLADGLTGYDREREAVVPALAHHWEGEAGGRRWHFWLRPGLRFQDGRPLGAEDVRQTLLRLRDTPGPHQATLAHLQAIEHEGPRLTLQLSAADHWLPHRLAHHAAAIVPAGDWHRPDFAALPIGAGAFRMVRNNAHRATLQAFDGYWRERALLDEIDLWVVPHGGTLPEVPLRLAQGHVAAETKDGRGLARPDWHHLQQAEQGCDFVLLNPARPAFATSARRRAVGDWLRGRVARNLGPLHHIATGWLPGWSHVPAGRQATAPSLPRRALLVTYELQPLIDLAHAVADSCRKQGCEVTIRVLPYPEFAQRRWPAEADMVVAGEVLSDDLAFGQFAALQGDALFHTWLAPALRRWLAAQCTRIAAEPDPALRAAAMAAAFARITAAGDVIPLRHTLQQLVHAPEVGGVSLARCGWMDFRRLWLAQA